MDKSVKEIRKALAERTAPYLPLKDGTIIVDTSNCDKSLRDVSMVIACSTPKEYLGSWFASCSTGMKLSIAPALAKEFVVKMLSFTDEELLNVFEEAETRASEIIKTLKGERE